MFLFLSFSVCVVLGVVDTRHTCVVLLMVVHGVSAVDATHDHSQTPVAVVGSRDTRKPSLTFHHYYIVLFIARRYARTERVRIAVTWFWYNGFQCCSKWMIANLPHGLPQCLRRGDTACWGARLSEVLYLRPSVSKVFPPGNQLTFTQDPVMHSLGCLLLHITYNVKLGIIVYVISVFQQWYFYMFDV